MIIVPGERARIARALRRGHARRGERAPCETPIPLDGFPAGADLTVRVLAGGQLFWILYGPPGGPRASSFIIPYRDEVASTAVQTFAVTIVAQSDRVELPSCGSFYRRSSSTREGRVTKR